MPGFGELDRFSAPPPLLLAEVKEIVRELRKRALWWRGVDNLYGADDAAIDQRAAALIERLTGGTDAE